MNLAIFSDPTTIQTWHAEDMHETRRSLVATAAISVAGTTLVAIGVAGLFLPVIPGIVLIGSGLAVLGKQYGWARRALHRVTPSRLQRPSEQTSDAEAA
jgi:hypothetical protein